MRKYLLDEKELTGMMKVLANRFARKHFLEFEEVFAEAMAFGFEVQSSWDEERGKEEGAQIKTYIYSCTFRHLCHWVRKEYRESNRNVDEVATFGGVTTDAYTGITPERQAILRELARNLPNEAHHILRILFEAPGDIINCAGGFKPKLMAGILKKRCTETMTHDEYRKGCRELRLFVQHYH